MPEPDRCPVCEFEPCECTFTAEELAEAVRPFTDVEKAEIEREKALLRGEQLH